MSKRSFVADSYEDLPAGSGADVWHRIFRIVEPGELLLLHLFSTYNGIQWRIILDSKIVGFIGQDFWRPSDLNDLLPNSRAGVCLAVYDAVNDYYTIAITLAFKWETSFEVLARNPSVGGIGAAANIYYDGLAEVPLPEPSLDVQQPGPKPDPVM